MKLFISAMASLTLFISETMGQPTIVIEIPRRASPFCKQELNQCLRFCQGPYCATECTDYLHQCMIRQKRFFWKDHHHHWHHPGRGHHKRHWHHKYKHPKHKHYRHHH